MNIPRGYTLGPCWMPYCSGKVAWPPNTVTATVVCDDTIHGPHRGVVRPATPNPQETK